MHGMRRRLTFTIYHGLIASLAIHATMAAPFLLTDMTSPPDEPEFLVLNLQGVAANQQDDEKVRQETKEIPKEVAAPPPPPVPEEKETTTEQAERAAASEERVLEPQREPESERKEEEEKPQETKPAQSSVTGSNNTAPETQQRQASTITMEDAEADRIKAYVRQLSKKVRANLTYPDSARGQRLVGIPFVSFTILPSGEVRPGTLRVVTSSGRAKLDAAALKTIAASAPFDPPPREMTVVIDVNFERDR